MSPDSGVTSSDASSEPSPDESNLQTYTQVYGQSLVVPYAFQYGVQDVYQDGTCPRIRYNVRGVLLNDSPHLDVVEEEAVFDCAENVRSRLLIVCANQSYRTPMPIHPDQIRLLKSRLNISAGEFWSVIEQSPSWSAWLQRMELTPAASDMAFWPRAYVFEPSSRLYNLGDMHLLDLGVVSLGKANPHMCMALRVHFALAS